MKAPKQGPIYLDQKVPYDYFVVIDAGSSGSRVYVYNWPNPLAILHSGGDFSSPDVRLVHREDVGGDSDSDSDEELSATEGKSRPKKAPKKGSPSQKVDKSAHVSTLSAASSSASARPFRVPKIHTGKKWNRKIKPGLATFLLSPQKIGKHHLRYLLQLASAVVPKSQHHRTPIFLHSTAGMRLLDLKDQQRILDSICSYLTSNSDFYLPECTHHINVIDGDVEGLYGWLAVNYLQGSMDHPEDHQHGKGHTTYGLLDMGGASTQVVFQPNTTEIEEHQNNLFRINLYELPTSQDGTYSQPERVEYNVYSDSFLGFGMYQAHGRYHTMLAEAHSKEHNLEPMAPIPSPVIDPCLPKGYMDTAVVDDRSVNLVGSSDFPGCLKAIFSVISNKAYVPTVGTSKCEELGDDSAVSACLLNDLIPSFDFDVNHFVGVSGYWDAINGLFRYEGSDENEGKKKGQGQESKEKRELRLDENYQSHPSDPRGLNYDYKRIYKQTSRLCSLSFAELKERSKLKGKGLLDEADLANLCFKSSWILNFLHQSLGFPRFGIDSEPAKTNRFQSLQLVEKVGGLPFSWTLGRAILYANDDYVQAYNNFTASAQKADKTSWLKRPGFYHSVSPNAFNYGGEQKGVIPRLQFEHPDPTAKYHHYDYETDAFGALSELKWLVQPHRWHGAFIFMSLIVFILWLMLGRNGRTQLKQKVSQRMRRLQFWKKEGEVRYTEVGQAAGFELRDLEEDV